MKQAIQTLLNLSKCGSQLRETLKLVGLKLYLLAFVFALTACASNQGLVFHSFQFDLRIEHQDVELLNYRYGDSTLGRPAEWQIEQGKIFYWNGVTGSMPRGEFFSAKWRIRSSQQVFEDRVDLRHRLPANIEDHTLTFMIKGPQLYIYLVTPNPIPKGESPNGPRIYRDRKVITLYPDQAKQ